MTFRVPSFEKIDYVAEIREHNKLLKIYKIERQKGIKDPKCPCKSGKVWRNCHGKSKYFNIK
jgi:hypothetical protein